MLIRPTTVHSACRPDSSILHCKVISTVRFFLSSLFFNFFYCLHSHFSPFLPSPPLSGTSEPVPFTPLLHVCSLHSFCLSAPRFLPSLPSSCQYLFYFFPSLSCLSAPLLPLSINLPSAFRQLCCFSLQFLLSFRFICRYFHWVPFASFCLLGTCTAFSFCLLIARFISSSPSSLLLASICFQLRSCLVCVWSLHYTLLPQNFLLHIHPLQSLHPPKLKSLFISPKVISLHGKLILLSYYMVRVHVQRVLFTIWHWLIHISYIFLSYIYLGYFVCVCVCVCVTICVGTLGYSFSFINQTDQGDEREGLKREGLKMER